MRNIKLIIEYDGTAYCGWPRQVAHFHTTSHLGERNFLMGINCLLPADITIREVREVDPFFHARFDVKSKVYIYRICNRPVRPALERHRAWFIWVPLDRERIEGALGVFQGTHDFSSFCSTHTDSQDHIRTILDIGVTEDANGMINISLEADGFLRYMVRNIVGSLVDIGRGKLSLEDLTGILAAKDRRKAGLTAPPQGLYLKEVKYG